MNEISFRKSDRGASLVLVAAYSTIVIAMAAVLYIVASMLLSSAEYRGRQDQAYELCTSLSNRLDELILNESEGGNKSCIVLADGVLVHESSFDGIPDSDVIAEVTSATDAGGNTYYILTITATAARETYVRTTEYSGDATKGYTRR
ncbi:MAG: hypothetical protein K5871_10950 [Lachnospiraceae bacterium]|nr:hypothetical protein [Lachnospiraceae bacterium]